jgi:hypothetical protein
MLTMALARRGVGLRHAPYLDTVVDFRGSNDGTLFGEIHFRFCHTLKLDLGL